MAQFQYKAIDAMGKSSTGTVDAANLADLETRLRRTGMDLIRAKEIKDSKRRTRGRPIKRRDIIAFCFHMEQLMRAGVPILDGLGDLRDTLEHPQFRQVIAGVIEAIEGGLTLSEGMAAYPKVFDNVTTSLIKAGEQTGELARVFEKLTESLKWQDEQIARTKKLVMYPSIIGLVVMSVVVFLMTYLVPKLVSFINIMGQELPAHTLALIWFSEFLISYWYIVFGTPVVLFFVLKWYVSVSPSVRMSLDRMKLHIWLVGPLIQKTILARFSNYFALMYSSGITVLESMRISEEIVNNRALAAAMHKAGQQIADGASISSGFEQAGLFPPLVLRMLRVGESTGELDTALLNISYFYTRDVEESVERLQTMIEPAMTIFLAVILGWVMFSVLGPIYDLISSVKI